MQAKTTGVSILLITVGLVTCVFFEWHHRIAIAGERRAYLGESAARSERQADMLSDTITQIYRSMRTIARLPSVRELDPGQSGPMDRDGTSLDENNRQVIQEIYNAMAVDVSLSELYLVPLTLDPDGEHEGRPREPWITFDALILGRTAGRDGEHEEHEEEEHDIEEIEIFEYRLMRRQLDLMRARYPTLSSIEGLHYPMLAGPPVVTCDNSRFDPAHPDDADRTGIVLSVPIYGEGGALRGCVSAIMLNAALEDLLDGECFAIVSDSNGVRISPQVSQSNNATGKPIYHERLRLQLPEGMDDWYLECDRPDADFYARAGVRTAERARIISLGATGGVTILFLWVVQVISRTHRHLQQARDELRELNRRLEEKVAERTAQLESLVMSDELTGLPNRRRFEQVLRRTMMSARRNPMHYAVLFFDFDRFKVVNDSLGHDVGDALLLSIAERFRNSLRETDLAARFGGDEFVVLLSPLASPQDAVLVAEKLLAVFAEPHQIAGHAIVSTASIGVVTSEHAPTGCEEMIRDADSAMYHAKAMGKGRVVVFDKELHDQAVERLRIEEDLRGAIQREELVLTYQPIVEIDSGRIVAAECLIQWNHPLRGRVGADAFIPVAEESGLIVPIGQWVMTTTCALMARLIRDGVVDDSFALAVNVSKRQLLDPGFVDSVDRTLDVHGVDPRRIWMEITETTIVDNRSGAASVVSDLRDRGLRILMDDFGTGHSSLAGLNEMPVDMLKIDKAFLRSAQLDKRLISIIQSIVVLADNLGMRTIGEGAETAEDVALLNALECAYGQGFYYSRPCDAENLIAMLREGQVEHRPAA